MIISKLHLFWDWINFVKDIHDFSNNVQNKISTNIQVIRAVEVGIFLAHQLWKHERVDLLQKWQPVKGCFWASKYFQEKKVLQSVYNQTKYIKTKYKVH